MRAHESPFLHPLYRGRSGLPPMCLPHPSIHVCHIFLLPSDSWKLLLTIRLSTVSAANGSGRPGIGRREVHLQEPSAERFVVAELLEQLGVVCQ